MELVVRSAWGARPPRKRVQGNLKASSTLHWNGPTIKLSGALTWDHSKCASLVRGTQAYHMDSKGWSDIAYNFVVCPHGFVFEGRGINIENGANGTNAANASSHAIMALSGKDNPFTDAEKATVVQLTKYISERSSAPDKLIGHRDHKSTECPGEARYVWLKQLRSPSQKPDVQVEKTKDITMEAAIQLIILHYKKRYGQDYDVVKKDLPGYIYWLDELLKAHDAGKPLKPVVDYCVYLLNK